MIAFIIRACDALDINLEIQYNDSFDPSIESDFGPVSDKKVSLKPSSDSATTVSISGMTCAACTSSVEDALQKVRGVQDLTVSLPLQEARIFHESGLDPKEFLSAVEGAGFEAKIGAKSSQEKIASMQGRDELERLRSSLTQSMSGSSLIFALGIGADYLGPVSLLQVPGISLCRQLILLGTTLCLCATSGHWIFSSAIDAFRNGRTNMHSLIAVSTFMGIAMSIMNLARNGFYQPKTYYDTVVGVMFIVTAGRYCDILSRRQASNTFVGLYSMLQEAAILQIKGSKVCYSYDLRDL